VGEGIHSPQLKRERGINLEEGEEQQTGPGIGTARELHRSEGTEGEGRGIERRGETEERGEEASDYLIEHVIS